MACTENTAYQPLPSIPQRLLKKLRDARRDKNDANTRAETLRREVLQLHDEGASPDPGLLSLRVDKRQVQTITKDAIVEILGQDALRQLMDAIEPKTVRTVVVENPTEDARKESERRYGHRVQSQK